MRKILYLTLLVLLLLPARAASSYPSGSRFTSLFCPEEWTYLFGHGATDMRGNCAACGKYPLELEVQTMRWFWCTQQRRWLQDACKQNAKLRCCTGEESLAAVTRPGPTLMRTWYCPEHRDFKGIKLPLLQTVVCSVNTKPMVAVWATEKTWYWCEMEGLWADHRCTMDAMKKCCTPRTGLLLATPEPGPLAEE